MCAQKCVGVCFFFNFRDHYLIPAESGNYLLVINPLNAELNPICHLPALLGAHHIFHVSGLRVKGVTKRVLFVVVEIMLNVTFGRFFFLVSSLS